MEPDTGTTIFINLIHYPVYTLGIGKRIGIWLQGCSIGCKGCISQHTWVRQETHKTTVSTVLQEIEKYRDKPIDGITISGGEPFQQPEALFNLLANLKSLQFEDIMVYSGYRYNYLKKKYSAILAMIDILVDGKFEEGQETDYIWKGSENQNMVFLTENEKLKEKYSIYRDTAESKRKLQIISAKDNFINIIGIPKQRDAKVIKDGIF